MEFAAERVVVRERERKALLDTRNQEQVRPAIYALSTYRDVGSCNHHRGQRPNYSHNLAWDHKFLCFDKSVILVS